MFTSTLWSGFPCRMVHLINSWKISGHQKLPASVFSISHAKLQCSNCHIFFCRGRRWLMSYSLSPAQHHSTEQDSPRISPLSFFNFYVIFFFSCCYQTLLYSEEPPDFPGESKLHRGETSFHGQEGQQL